MGLEALKLTQKKFKIFIHKDSLQIEESMSIFHKLKETIKNLQWSRRGNSNFKWFGGNN